MKQTESSVIFQKTLPTVGSTCLVYTIAFGVVSWVFAIGRVVQSVSIWV